jgi:UDP-N-acetylmuramyl pentapeptide phosphotransferase/UDP-N-acetylglucosamine-1-phosphate transferase
MQMPALVFAFLISLAANFFIVRYKNLHLHLTADSDISGVQKFHVLPVPRIGGAGIFLGVLGAFSFRYFQNAEVGLFGLLLIFASLPAFLAGFLEDITKKVGIKFRLIATILSAAIAGLLLNAWLTSIQVFGIDNLLQVFPTFAIIFTCIGVAGVANSFNIIDGYNGLSSMVAVTILVGIAYVAFQVEDHLIMVSALVMVGALLGFLVLNYPRGLIFLGDGGAYLVGFWIAELSVLLTARHSEISKWFPLLLCIYPIFETMFTIYRRVVLMRNHPGLPDALHLHQLIYRRLVPRPSDRRNSQLLTIQNAKTSPYLWALSLFAVIPAILFWQNHLVLKFFSLVFIATYLWIYWRIVCFRSPFKLWRQIFN